jgi:hypothetical protein
VFAQLIDVKGELCADMGVRVLVVSDGNAVLPLNLLEGDGDGWIDGVVVPRVVADVVRQGAEDERILVGVSGVLEKGS